MLKKNLGSDFLASNYDILFDLILMNPPFWNADKHLIHAWNIMVSGDIVCLVNSETINNPHTESRKLLMKIIEDNKGTIEDLGQCFSTAERPTDVNVSLIRLTKVSTKTKIEF